MLLVCHASVHLTYALFDYNRGYRRRPLIGTLDRRSPTCFRVITLPGLGRGQRDLQNVL